MKKLLTFYIALMPLLFSAGANALVINEYSVFINSTTLSGDSLSHSPIGSGDNGFFGTGIDSIFTDNLSADGFGNVSWQLSNNTGSILENVQLFVFLDAEVDQTINTFFNESGALVDVSGTGANDNRADSWEIDEPGFVFGDIFDHLLQGALDNTNSVGAGAEDDVSLALGFDLGNLLPGDSLNSVFDISLANIGGLSHTDPDSLSTFYFNGTVDVERVTAVAEPSLVIALVFSLLVLLSRPFIRD